MKFELRPYQEQSVELLRMELVKGHRRPILQLPTGGGKTVTFSHIAENAVNKGSRVLVACHRRELIDQARKTMKSYGVRMADISFGMVQTFVRSPHKIPKFDIVIIDECHIGNFRRFVELDQVRDKVIIGATATPISSSDKTPLRDIFHSVVSPVSIRELVDEGFLSKPIYHIYNLDDSKLKKGASGDFTEKSQSSALRASENDLLSLVRDIRGQKSIIFTPSIEMTVDIAHKITDCYFVHSKMTSTERTSVVEKYKADPSGIMVNCGILTAGFDDPDINNVIVYRATNSLPLWLQMVGRGSRVTRVKEEFHIYDLGHNCKRLGSWHSDINWVNKFETQGMKVRESDQSAPMKSCPECETLLFASMMKCDVCGYDFPAKNKEADTQSIDVLEYNAPLPEHLRRRYSDMSVKDLLDRAEIGSLTTGKPYSVNWVVNQLKRRDNPEPGIRELARIKGYRAGWIDRQLDLIRSKSH